MRAKRIDGIAVGLAAAIAGLLFLQHRLVAHASYVPDEFLHVAWAGDLHAGVHAYAADALGKTRLSIALFRFAYYLGDHTEQVLWINRHLVWLFVVLSLFCLFAIAREVFHNTHGALWAVVWTLLCTTFIERSFRIRSDMIATFLALLAVHSYLSLGSWRRTAVAGLWLGLAFCTTQKSVYFIAAFCIAYAAAGRKCLSRPVRDFLIFTAAGVLVFLIYLLVFGRGGYYIEVLKKTFLEDLAVKAALGTSFQEYFDTHWHYHVQTFVRNIAFYCLSFIGLTWALMRWRQHRPEQNFVAIYSLAVLIFIFFHRSPWPYVFILVIPFLGIYAGWLSVRIQQALEQAPRLLLAPALALLLVTAVDAILRHKSHLSITNEAQLRAVRAAEAILGPKDTYYDGVRMIGTRRPASPVVLYVPTINRLVEHWETEGLELMEELLRNRCKVVIYTHNCLAGLPEGFHRFLQAHYVLIDQNVFVAGAEVTTSPAEVMLVWGGPYGVRVEGECHDLTIDGKATNPSAIVPLHAGRHSISFRGEATLLLLPIQAKRWIDTQPAQPRLDNLFWMQYSL